MTLELICYLIAVILLVLAAFRVSTPVIDLFPLGVAFAVFPLLVHAFHAVS